MAVFLTLGVMPLSALAAITPGTATSALISPVFSGVFSADQSYTVSAGQNMLTLRITTGDVTSVTWNAGTPQNFVQESAAFSGNNGSVAVWDLLNPTPGTFNIHMLSGHGTPYAITAQALSGVDSVTPIPSGGIATYGAFNVPAAPNVTVNSTAGGIVIDIIEVENSVTVTSAGSGQTTQMLNNNYTGTLNGSTSIKTSTTSTTNMSWTMSAGNYTALIAVAYNAAATVTPVEHANVFLSLGTILLNSGTLLIN